MCLKLDKIWILGIFQGKKGFCDIIRRCYDFSHVLRVKAFSLVARYNWVRFGIHPKTVSSFRVSPRIYAILLYHGTITRAEITCKKISCDMHDSACRWLIVQNVKIFRNYVKHFWIFPRERNCKILVGLCK